MRKKVIAVVFLMIYSCMFLGCNLNLTKLPTIPFEKFVLEDDIQEKDIELDELSKTINKDELKELTKNINELFNITCGKENYYKNYYNLEKYFENTKEFFTEEYYEGLIADKNNNIKKIADNIYSKENRFFKQAEIIEFEEEVDKRYLIAEVVYVDDSKSFIVDKIKLNIDEECKISDSEIISQEEAVNNTTKALSAEDSIINDDDIDNFKKIFLSFLGDMRNEDLYKNISDEENKLKLASLIENLNLEKKDSKVLEDLFLAGRGTFNNYYVTKVHLDDKEGLAKSLYTISFVNGKKVKEFKVYFSRVNQSITSISV